jgi:hypothetical protein
MTERKDRPRIDGKTATYVAIEAAGRGPIALQPLESSDSREGSSQPQSKALQAELTNRRAPPRVRKPSPLHDECVAPTADFDGHRGRLREAFGNTLSDEFTNVMLGKLVEALRPSPSGGLDEATLNAALALIHSMKPKTELDALLAVQIVATGFSGLRFLHQSQTFLIEPNIDVHGGYAIRLLRLQVDLIQAFDRHRRGNRQTVEVRHVHLHPGSQGVVGIVNNGRGTEGEREAK